MVAALRSASFRDLLKGLSFLASSCYRILENKKIIEDKTNILLDQLITVRLIKKFDFAGSALLNHTEKTSAFIKQQVEEIQRKTKELEQRNLKQTPEVLQESLQLNKIDTEVDKEVLEFELVQLKKDQLILLKFFKEHLFHLLVNLETNYETRELIVKKLMTFSFEENFKELLKVPDSSMYKLNHEMEKNSISHLSHLVDYLTNLINILNGTKTEFLEPSKDSDLDQ